MIQVPRISRDGTKEQSSITRTWPEVMLIPIATMIMAQTRRCSWKKSCECLRKATMPMVKVAQATLNPNAHSGEAMNFGILRRALPKCCYIVQLSAISMYRGEGISCSYPGRLRRKVFRIFLGIEPRSQVDDIGTSF